MAPHPAEIEKFIKKLEETFASNPDLNSNLAFNINLAPVKEAFAYLLKNYDKEVMERLKEAWNNFDARSVAYILSSASGIPVSEKEMQELFNILLQKLS